MLALTVACLTLYLQVSSFDFINIDDRPFIYENPAVLSGLNSKSIWWAFTAFHSANWHPVTWLSHMLDVTLFGPNPGPMHVVNVILHTIDSILVFVVFNKLTRRLWPSASVAFLFAIHPAHVESVAWLAERRDVLSTMFWLLTMLAYFSYADRKKEPVKGGGLLARAGTWLVITCILFALGLMSKAMLVTLPFVLLLCDYWPLDRLNEKKDLWPLIKEKFPLFALTIGSSVITYLSQSGAGAMVSMQTSSVGDRLISVTLAYARYVVMMFYPVNLGILYPFENAFNSVEIAGSVVLLLAITALCWHQRKQRRYLTIGWLWFLGTLVPVVGIVQIGMQSHADRYTYIPYFGLFIMFAWGAADLISKFKIDHRVTTAASIIVIAILGFLTFVQVGKWKNSETLYTHTLSFTSKNYLLLSNLCLYYINNADKPTAESRCTELLEATPPTAETYNILGMLRTDVGKFDDAESFLERGIQMNPNWAILYLNYSVALTKQNKVEDAEKALLKAKSISDGSISRQSAARACNDLAQAFEKRGQIGKAKDYYLQAVQLDPDFADATANFNRVNGTK